jgi:hypothetical protein
VPLWNGSPIGSSAPDNEKICSGRSLAETLAQIKLPDGETRIWRHDLPVSRKSLKAPIEKCNSSGRRYHHKQ